MSRPQHFSEDVRKVCINAYKDVWRHHYKMIKTVEIVKMKPENRSDFEYYLILGLLYPDIFYQQMEVAVPPNWNHATYIRANVHLYHDLLDRIPDSAKLMHIEYARKIYEKLNDNVLISMIGGYPVFENRMSLVNNILNMLYVKNWFVLLSPDMNKVRNKDGVTTLLSTLDDLAEEGAVVLAYGNSREYVFFEAEELMTSIRIEEVEHENMKEKMWVFQNPQGGTFSSVTLYTLLELTSIIAHLDQRIAQLHVHVLTALSENSSYSEEEIGLRDTYAQLDDKERKTISQFLETIFHMGMYMRRWGGPGHPYPIKEEDTKSKDASFEIKITECVNVIDNLLKEFKLLHQFYIVNCGKKERRFVTLFNTVKDGNYCIRSASKRFISTAVWYRLLLMKDTWPDIDINQIDSII